MAVRYIPAAELPPGYYKPGDTLGKHHCEVVHHIDHLVVYGGDSRAILYPGDTLGYDHGRVWRVPRPEEYKDPLRRVCAEFRLGKRVLVMTDEPVITIFGYGSRYPGSGADRSFGEYLVAALGTPQEQYIQSTPVDWDEPARNGGLFGEQTTEKFLGGEILLFEEVCGRNTAFRLPRRISRVVVRKAVSRKRAAEWLREHLATYEG